MSVQKITSQEFKDKVFNYQLNKDWSFSGEKPVIIDFYADWCAPCQALAPILEEISHVYEGDVEVYKVNTEEEQELSSAFGIRSIPTMLFIPRNGNPQMAAGLMPKNAIETAIDEIFNVKKKA